MSIGDQDEWLQPDAVHDEVVIEVGEPLELRVSLVVTPNERRVSLVATIDGVEAKHHSTEGGPPTTNWDRMELGGVEWRMVEVLRCWDLSVDAPNVSLQAYLSFCGIAPPTPLADGYAQAGTVSGQLQLADRRTTLTNAPARRSHTWH